MHIREARRALKTFSIVFRDSSISVIWCFIIVIYVQSTCNSKFAIPVMSSVKRVSNRVFLRYRA
jgi:hypothetical protein